MNGFAFALIFVAAFIHASWNLLAKRSSEGGSFVFLTNALSVLLYMPLCFVVLVVQRPSVNAVTLIFIVGSAITHLVYFLVLQRGYRVGDLSLVYPLARGTGPMISTTAAIAFLGEHPTPLAITGIVLIISGVFVLTGNPRQLWKGSRIAVSYGVLTGVMIASYTIWDKCAVSQFAISPILLNYGSNVFEALLLVPFALRHWQPVEIEWRRHRREILGVAVLSPLAYLLVLMAMVFTPVSHVAPLRELSILVGTVMGNRLLAEGEASRRLLASAIIVLGIVTLAVN